MGMQIIPLGDQALLVELGQTIDESTHQKVQSAWRSLAAEPLPGVTELVPAYTTVTAYYDPVQAVQGAPADKIVDWLSDRLRDRLKIHRRPRKPKVVPSKFRSAMKAILRLILGSWLNRLNLLRRRLLNCTPRRSTSFTWSASHPVFRISVGCQKYWRPRVMLSRGWWCRPVRWGLAVSKRGYIPARRRVVGI